MIRKLILTGDILGALAAAESLNRSVVWYRRLAVRTRPFT